MKKQKTRYVRYLYECRLCGKIYSTAESSEKIAQGKLMEAILSATLYENSGFRLMMHDTHLCSKKQMGIADLIGYTEAKE